LADLRNTDDLIIDIETNPQLQKMNSQHSINNYFKFGEDTYWLQISGTAMGTPLAVTFACIYIGQLEKQAFDTLSLKHALPYAILIPSTTCL